MVEKLTVPGYRRVIRKLQKIYREWKRQPMTTPRLRRQYENWEEHYSIIAFDECSYLMMAEVARKLKSSLMEPYTEYRVVQGPPTDGDIMMIEKGVIKTLRLCTETSS